MNALLPLNFEGFPVRMVEIDSAPWFVLVDVCCALEIMNPTRAAAKLDEDEKGLHTVKTLGGEQQVNVINESGLYSLILTSRKPAAKRFKKWVTGEVLPAIRRTGRYEPTATVPTANAEIITITGPWLHLSIAKEARLLFGPEHAKALWRKLGLPAP